MNISNNCQLELHRELASLSPVESTQGRLTLSLAVEDGATQSQRAQIEYERLLAQVEMDRLWMEETVHLIAHDMLQPLTVAWGHVQYLRLSLEEGNLERARRGVEALDVSTRRLEVMIRGLVDSTRLDAGKSGLDRQPLDLKQFIHAALGRMCFLCDLDQVRVEATELVVAHADPDPLERILGNLVSNALKYR